MVYNHTSQPSLSSNSIAFPSPVHVTLASFFSFLPFLHHSPVSTRFQFPVNSSGSPSRDRHSSSSLFSFCFSAPCSLQLLEIFRNAQLCSPSASLFVTSSLSRLASPRPTLASIYFPASSTFLEILWIVRSASLLAGTISFVLSNFSDICLSALPPPLFPNNFPFIAFRFHRYFLIYRSSARVFFYHVETWNNPLGNRKNYPNYFFVYSENKLEELEISLTAFSLKIPIDRMGRSPSNHS